jgi:hypothetical protein
MKNQQKDGRAVNHLKMESALHPYHHHIYLQSRQIALREKLR